MISFSEWKLPKAVKYLTSKDVFPTPTTKSNCPRLSPRSHTVECENSFKFSSDCHTQAEPCPSNSIHLNKGKVERQALISYQLDELGRSTTKERMDFRGSGEAGGGVGEETGGWRVSLQHLCVKFSEESVLNKEYTTHTHMLLCKGWKTVFFFLDRSPWGCTQRQSQLPQTCSSNVILASASRWAVGAIAEFVCYCAGGF